MAGKERLKERKESREQTERKKERQKERKEKRKTQTDKQKGIKAPTDKQTETHSLICKILRGGLVCKILRPRVCKIVGAAFFVKF